MKVLVLFFSSILVISLIDSSSAFGIPDCHVERDLDILWPCYDDKTKYYQCLDIHEPVLMPCSGGTWFDFTSQSCKRPHDWRPFMTTPKHVTTVKMTSKEEKEIEPKPKPEPEPEPQPEPEPWPEPEIRTTQKSDLEIKTEIEKNPTPAPPIITRRTTKNRVPPTKIKTKRSTRKPHPTPSTPIGTAPTEHDINEKGPKRKTSSSKVNSRKPPPPPTKKAQGRTKRLPPTLAPVTTEDDTDKTKIVRRQKTKIVPTRASRS